VRFLKTDDVVDFLPHRGGIEHYSLDNLGYIQTVQELLEAKNRQLKDKQQHTD